MRLRSQALRGQQTRCWGQWNTLAQEQRLLYGIGRQGSLSGQDNARMQLQYIEDARGCVLNRDGPQRAHPNAGE